MTNAELALLTILAESPHHGYDIERVIDERGMREWTEIGFSSIYYLLKKSEQMGYVEGKLEETTHGPARRVYHLTAAGRQALHEAVLKALSVPYRRYPPLELALANLPSMTTAEVVTALGQYLDALASRIKHVWASLERQRPLPYFAEAMFTYAIAMGQAEHQWVEQFIQQVQEQHDRVRHRRIE
jgi:DNA-binding PadR family transcriptional regulator